MRKVLIKLIELDRKVAAGGYKAVIVEELEKDSLDFRECRAQIYDNAVQQVYVFFSRSTG